MNWYKKIIASKKPTFTVRSFLKALKDYGVILERQGAGSRNILLNTTNNKRTNLHSHGGGMELGQDAIRKMLRDLGINYWEFMGIKADITEEQVQNQPNQQGNIPEWQKQPWYQQQQQYAKGKPA